MKKIFVNSIQESKNLTLGMAMFDSTIEESLKVLYKPMEIEVMKGLAKELASKGGAHFFKAFGQYVVLVQLWGKSQPMGVVKFMDFKNNWDFALDEYIRYEQNNVSTETKNQLMIEFKKINDNKNIELVELVRVSPF